MNDPKQLFEEIFCNAEHEKVAVLYLASLVSASENDEEYYAKIQQVSLLRDFFESTPCSRKAYYFQKLRDIEEILQKDRAVGRQDMPARGEHKD